MAVEAERRDGVRHLLRGQLLVAGGGAVLRRPLQGRDERDDGAGVAQDRPGDLRFPPGAPGCGSGGNCLLCIVQVLMHDVAHDAEGDVHHPEVALAQQREEPEGQGQRQVYQLLE